MKVKDIMTKEPRTCRPDTPAIDAAAIMKERDCGVVPVTDDDGRILGMVTDRDICLALATRDTRPSELRVREIMSSGARSCSPEDDSRTALDTMRQCRVRRLAVVDSVGRTVGVLSLNDIVLATNLQEETFGVMKEVCEHTSEARR